DLVTGPEVLGRRAAAEHVASFEYAHLVAGSREVRSANEAVVATTNDDCVEVRRPCHEYESVVERATNPPLAPPYKGGESQAEQFRCRQPIELAGAGGDFVTEFD